MFNRNKKVYKGEKEVYLKCLGGSAPSVFNDYVESVEFDIIRVSDRVI